MTSERQRQANRRNAARSTGPRTTAGKKRASKNAFKHGLAISISSDPAKSADIARLAAVLGGEGPGLDPIQDDNARSAAEAHLELSRVRAFRAKRTPNEPASEIAPATENRASTANWRVEFEATTQAVQELTKAERYERRAFSKRNRALRKLKSVPTDPM